MREGRQEANKANTALYNFNSRPCARGDSNSAQKCAVDYVQNAKMQVIIRPEFNYHKQFKQITCINVRRIYNCATVFLRRPASKICFAAIGAKYIYKISGSPDFIIFDFPIEEILFL